MPPLCLPTTPEQARTAALHSSRSSAPLVPSAPSQATATSTTAAPNPISVPVTAVPATIFLKLGDAEDVIEQDLPVKSFAELVYVFYTEYNLKPQEHKILKIRKLPNVLVRNDKDVGRIRPGDTLQLVLTPPSTTSATSPSGVV